MSTKTKAKTSSTKTKAAARKTSKKAAVKRQSTKTAKKTAKKVSAVKKSAKKAATTPKKAEEKAAKAAASAMRDIIARARDHFRRAPETHVFYLSDGKQLRDIKELAEAFEEMADTVFHHHVNDQRHDFANWVHEVLQERALAEQMRSAERHPQAHQHVIYKHIVRRTW